MNDYLPRLAKTILIMAVVVLSVAYVKERREPRVILVQVQDPNYVQGVCEAQERLKVQHLYNGRIDGVWGKETERAFCNWCAIREFEGEEQ